MPVHARPLAAMFAVVALSFGLVAHSAQAQQIPPPPAFIYGSITDADGPVPEGIPVEAIVNDNVCGQTETRYVGDGDGQITFYAIDVHAHGQTEGCGRPGDPIRLRVGDRLVPGTVTWETGIPVHNDIVFGDATPAPIPTVTPTPEGADPATPSPDQGQEPPDSENQTPSPAGEGDDSTSGPGGEPANGQGGDSPGDDADAEELEGQLTSATPGQEAAGATTGNGGGGMPVWAVLLLVVGGIAVAGGGIGYMMARGSAKSDEDSMDDGEYGFAGDSPAGEDDYGADDYSGAGYAVDEGVIGGEEVIGDDIDEDDRIG